jgi:DNA-binding GntR family transcriptional regulator
LEERVSGESELVAERASLGRTSTVERLADILRSRIIRGQYVPGERLAEDVLVKSLGVSRNTVREAFRLLNHERLLVHELNRGVFVRKLTVDDVVDIYRVRKLVECAAVRRLASGPAPLADLAAAVADGEAAMRAADWQALGTANMMFHQAVGALAASPRVDELMRGILAELRLVFHLVADPRRLHEPYLERNREVLAALEAGDAQRAERLLHKYLDDSEQAMVAAYTQQVDA